MSVDIAVGPMQGSIVEHHDLLHGSVILKSGTRFLCQMWGMKTSVYGDIHGNSATSQRVVAVHPMINADHEAVTDPITNFKQ